MQPATSLLRYTLKQNMRHNVEEIRAFRAYGPMFACLAFTAPTAVGHAARSASERAQHCPVEEARSENLTSAFESLNKWNRGRYDLRKPTRELLTGALKLEDKIRPAGHDHVGAVRPIVY